MSKFHYQPHINLIDQWNEHIQHSYYNDEITSALNSVESAIDSSKEFFKENNTFLKQGIGSQEILDAIYSSNRKLDTINNTLSEGFFNIEWRLDDLLTEQKYTNELIANLVDATMLPDEQKRRLYFLKDGLRYYQTLNLEKQNKDVYFKESLDEFHKVLKIKKRDVIANIKLGKLHLYHPQKLDLNVAEQYFSEALIELKAESHSTSQAFSNSLLSNNFSIIKLQIDIYRNLAKINYLLKNPNKAFDFIKYAYDISTKASRETFALEFIKYAAVSENTSFLKNNAIEYLSYNPKRNMLSLTSDKDINSNRLLMKDIGNHLKINFDNSSNKALGLESRLLEISPILDNERVTLMGLANSNNNLDYFELSSKLNKSNYNIDYGNRKFTGTLESIYRQIKRQETINKKATKDRELKKYNDNVEQNKGSIELLGLLGLGVLGIALIIDLIHWLLLKLGDYPGSIVDKNSIYLWPYVLVGFVILGVLYLYFDSKKK